MLNKEMVDLITEIKQIHGHRWHTAVVDEAMRLSTIVKLGLQSAGDMSRFIILRQFLSGQVQAADSMAALLEKAPRMGADEDEPGGSRYIQISDTLAKEIANGIRIGNPMTYPLARMED